MRSPIRLDHEKQHIIIDSSFCKLASNPTNNEYAKLNKIRADFPTYDLITRHIKKNKNKETYKGLTYEYMKNHIRSYEDAPKRDQMLKEFEELCRIADCHSQGKRYPLVKSWFLTKYPNVAKGMTRADYQKELEKTKQQETTNTQSESVMTPILNPVAA